MAGWSKKKRNLLEGMFYDFLDRCYVDSKDYGRICLGEHLYWGQRHAITVIFDALEDDIHDIYILKARQLGISTIVRALTVFFLGIHKGLKGALVFDTAPNRDEARTELVAMIRNLPASLKFPKVKGSGEGNREGLTLENDSRILFKSAGVKKSKSSGTLGRSVGLAFATLSELCSYDNDEGMESFEQSLSDVNPDRLYVRESTARGRNSWHTMWTEAREDTTHKRCIFLGWWSKESQRIDRDSPDFLRYGEQPPTEKELARIVMVREKYEYDVSQEQLAWYRRKMDPNAIQEGEAEVEFEGNSTKIQEQPWVEDEAFQMTGSQFFVDEKLNDHFIKHVKGKFQRYTFSPGVTFQDMQVSPATIAKWTDLKVWEEPDPEGVYIFACDPAFGENENNDRAAIEVGRCYADGVDQVAEFASPLPTPQQLAWILATLMGWYGGQSADVRYILELNGPGSAVFNEMKQLRFQLEQGYQRAEIDDKGLRNVLRNVRTYIYSRPDSMGAGNNWHFKTSLQLKIMIMNHLRDYVHTELFKIRSADLVEEMRDIEQIGDSIKASGIKKDDRVFASALLVYYWQTSVRKQLITQNRTRDAEAAKKSLTIGDQVKLFQQNQLQAFFDSKRQVRVQQAAHQGRLAWRYGRR